ncbi:hypothetical protein [Actinoplanes regularis]|uniref:Uncharacterized protein n=1 Tax=Actinoplanes regularis TaxID=52697 RepID=A0A239FY92_9ACTN|nr:hypothetical protein [Actinoplanes regularis]GIE90084.1 hypothetical protein Are01nite_65640 [Actinoplanes regularis]SNS61750.1 hypothetical protein SAMN06264365_119102 [Actinoplanes regularis]
MNTATVEHPVVPAPSAGATQRYATPTGAPCPYTLRSDGSVDGDGACRGCGACLLGAGWEA